jgi:hypothetical protein
MQLIDHLINFACYRTRNLVARGGIEPPTQGFSSPINSAFNHHYKYNAFYKAASFIKL